MPLFGASAGQYVALPPDSRPLLHLMGPAVPVPMTLVSPRPPLQQGTAGGTNADARRPMPHRLPLRGATLMALRPLPCCRQF